MSNVSVKERIAKLKQIFAPYISKPMTLQFDIYEFPIELKEIRLGKVGDISNNAPDKIYNPEKDKYETPKMFEIDTSDGLLNFLLDKTQVHILLDGIRLKIGEQEINFILRE